MPPSTWPDFWLNNPPAWTRVTGGTQPGLRSGHSRPGCRVGFLDCSTTDIWGEASMHCRRAVVPGLGPWGARITPFPWWQTTVSLVIARSPPRGKWSQLKSTVREEREYLILVPYIFVAFGLKRLLHVLTQLRKRGKGLKRLEEEMRGEIKKKTKKGGRKGKEWMQRVWGDKERRRSTNKGAMNRYEPFHWRAIASHAVLCLLLQQSVSSK